MVFKAFRDKFKVKSGQKFLEEELENPAVAVSRGQGISRIACIVDVDRFNRAEVFYELTNELSLRPNAVKVIGYKREYDKNSPYAIPMFSDKDLGWKGEIENGYVLEFLGREYDLLINYYTDDNLMMKLLTVKTPARLRVGFGEVDTKLNDLILHTPFNDFKAFKTELHKYLKVMKEVK